MLQNVKEIIWYCPGLYAAQIDDGSIISSSTIIAAFATLFAALLGSFLGPLFAFKLQRQEKKHRIKADNITAGNHALFILMRQYTRLDNVRKQFIEPVREHPLRFIIMRPTSTVIESDDLKLNMSNLSFFLQPQRNKNLQQKLRETLYELFLEEENFQTVVNSLNQRNRLHVEQVQPLLDQARVRLYADAPDQIQIGELIFSLPQDSDKVLINVELILSHALYQTLMQSTNNIIERIDDSLASLLVMRNKLRAAISELYPKNANDILFFTGRTEQSPTQ